MEGTVRCSANYVPLSPLSFIERSAEVYSDRTSVVYESIEFTWTSVVYESIKFTWRQTRDRCLRLASALSHLGVSRGDVPLAAEGIRHIGTEAVDVKDPETMKSVPADGKTMGEVMFRGNTVMNGYFKDLKATEEVFAGGFDISERRRSTSKIRRQ
ncbi:uncharacterized protein A4U43_C10F9780 [Asparagus officinalis]|uniref:Uncharacterized protein n=1 Tax=Asparagus officinalis TaxID=4686 RepID=A0A5P1E3J0_ASPOF|nr:uncharacterized protein A4U43_C10F9780 [Asparagus officinalis]